MKPEQRPPDSRRGPCSRSIPVRYSCRTDRKDRGSRAGRCTSHPYSVPRSCRHTRSGNGTEQTTRKGDRTAPPPSRCGTDRRILRRDHDKPRPDHALHKVRRILHHMGHRKAHPRNWGRKRGHRLHRTRRRRVPHPVQTDNTGGHGPPHSPRWPPEGPRHSTPRPPVLPFLSSSPKKSINGRSIPIPARKMPLGPLGVHAVA